MNALKPNHVVQVECFFDDYKKIKRNSKTFWKRFLIISGIISFIFFLSLLENKFDFAFFCEYIQLIILLFIFAYFILKLFDYIWIKTEYEELCDGDTKSIRYKVSFYDDSCELKYKENVKVYEYQNIKCI